MLAGGVGDRRALLNDPGRRNRPPLVRPCSQMPPSLVRATTVRGRKSRALVSADEMLTRGCGPPCSAPILDQIFIATMIGSQEAEYKGARRWTLPRIPVPIRATVAGLKCRWCLCCDEIP